MQASRICLHLLGPQGARTLNHRMKGRRNTRRKQAVIDAGKEVQGPFTAEQLFHMTQRFLPGVSRSTVYRTIGILRSEGCLKEIYLPHGRRIFAHTDADVLCIIECEECGRFTTCPAPALSGQLEIAVRERHLSSVHASIYARGRCDDWGATGRCRWGTPLRLLTAIRSSRSRVPQFRPEPTRKPFVSAAWIARRKSPPSSGR